MLEAPPGTFLRLGPTPPTVSVVIDTLINDMLEVTTVTGERLVLVLVPRLRHTVEGMCVGVAVIAIPCVRNRPSPLSLMWPKTFASMSKAQQDFAMTVYTRNLLRLLTRNGLSVIVRPDMARFSDPDAETHHLTLARGEAGRLFVLAVPSCSSSVCCSASSEEEHLAAACRSPIRCSSSSSSSSSEEQEAKQHLVRLDMSPKPVSFSKGQAPATRPSSTETRAGACGARQIAACAAQSATAAKGGRAWHVAQLPLRVPLSSSAPANIVNKRRKSIKSKYQKGKAKAAAAAAAHETSKKKRSRKTVPLRPCPVNQRPSRLRKRLSPREKSHAKKSPKNCDRPTKRSRMACSMSLESMKKLVENRSPEMMVAAAMILALRK